MARIILGNPEAEAIPVSKDKCELEGPYECPYCQGHLMLDASFLEQVQGDINCPYCLAALKTPEVP